MRSDLTQQILLLVPPEHCSAFLGSRSLSIITLSRPAGMPGTLCGLVYETPQNLYIFSSTAMTAAASCAVTDFALHHEISVVCQRGEEQSLLCPQLSRSAFLNLRRKVLAGGKCLTRMAAQSVDCLPLFVSSLFLGEIDSSTTARRVFLVSFHFSTTFAPLAARYWSGPPGGRVLTTPKISPS